MRWMPQPHSASVCNHLNTLPCSSHHRENVRARAIDLWLITNAWLNGVFQLKTILITCFPFRPQPNSNIHDERNVWNMGSANSNVFISMEKQIYKPTTASLTWEKKLCSHDNKDRKNRKGKPKWNVEKYWQKFRSSVPTNLNAEPWHSSSKNLTFYRLLQWPKHVIHHIYSDGSCVLRGRD